MQEIKTQRKRHSPEIVRRALVDVTLRGRKVDEVAKKWGVEYWTLTHWIGNVKKFGLEETILSFHPKHELIKMVVSLRKGFDI